MDSSKGMPTLAAGREPVRKLTVEHRQAIIACLGIALTLVLSASAQTIPFAGAGVIENDPSSSLFAALNTFSTALCLIGTGLITLRRPRIERIFAPLFAGCTLLSLLLWLVGTRIGGQWFGMASPLLIGSACSWGVGIGAAFMFWVPSLSAFRIEKAAIAAACATCLAGFLKATVFSISNPWWRCVTLGILIVATVGLAVCVSQPTPAPPRSESTLRPLAQLVRPIRASVLPVAIAGFASGALRALAQPQTSRLHLLALFLCALTAGVLYMLLARRSTNWLDAQVARMGMLAVVSTVFVMVPLTHGTTAVLLQAVIDICYMAGSIYIKVLCTHQSTARETPASCATGLSFGYIFLLVGLGFVLNKGLLAAFGSSPTSSLALSVIALYLVVIACILALVHKTFSKSPAQANKVAPALVLDVISEADLRSNGALRTQYRISEREMDVIVLMMGGESIAAISKALLLSENTVKSHIKKIYNKLDVHTKDEFRQLIRAVTESEATIAPHTGCLRSMSS